MARNLADLSVTQVRDLLSEYEETHWNVLGNWHDWEEEYWRPENDQEFVVVPDLGRVRVVESHGGEGKGDAYWMVFEVTEGDVTRHFKIDGYYASYDGGYYDGPFTEVKPVERVVTFYE